MADDYSHGWEGAFEEREEEVDTGPKGCFETYLDKNIEEMFEPVIQTGTYTESRSKTSIKGQKMTPGLRKLKETIADVYTTDPYFELKEAQVCLVRIHGARHDSAACPFLYRIRPIPPAPPAPAPSRFPTNPTSSPLTRSPSLPFAPLRSPSSPAGVDHGGARGGQLVVEAPAAG